MGDKLHFTKMHGLGNDFMLIDAISQKFIPDSDKIKAWGNRHTGIGFDQLLIVEKSNLTECDFKYRIFNTDGSEAEQCGNGARCFAKYIYEKGLTTKKSVRIETINRILTMHILDSGLIEVTLGQPKFDFQSIPFIPSNKGKDKNNIVQIVSIGALALPVVNVNIGNPHAVVMVDDLEETPVTLWGKRLEYSDQYPQRTNVEFMQIIDKNHIRIRVHERGAGETLACGSGACAAVVVGIKLGALNEAVTVSLPGGDLHISWIEQNDIVMVGPAVFVFDGVIEND